MKVMDPNARGLIFERVLRGRSSETRSSERARTQTSRHLRAYRSGQLSWDEYLEAKWRRTVAKLEGFLDGEDLAYLRIKWLEYLQEDLSHSGAYEEITRTLRLGARPGNEKKGDAVNQSNNTAEESDDGASEDLRLLERGEISLDEYIERRFAVVLDGQVGLSAEQRAEAKKILLETFSSDPVLRHYAAVAAGKPTDL